MKMHLPGILVLAAAVVTGCTGAQGNTGPMGPSGKNAPTPVYTYNQTFDSNTYSIGSEWTSLVQNGGGPMTLSLDSTLFVSGSKSFKIKGSAGVDSVVYSNSGVIPPYTIGDYTLDFYWNPANVQVPAVTVEAALISNGQALAALTFATGTPNTFTVNNGGSPYTLESVSSSPYFHHIVIVYHNTSGLSDYYDDNIMIGQNINAKATLIFPGEPISCVAFYFPGSLAPTDYFNVDNVEVYHY